jgi:hypothetical protein
MVNVCRKMPVISTFGVVLVGVAGFEPAPPDEVLYGKQRREYSNEGPGVVAIG